jgi:hypothetical protein
MLSAIGFTAAPAVAAMRALAVDDGSGAKRVEVRRW